MRVLHKPSHGAALNLAGYEAMLMQDRFGMAAASRMKCSLY